MSLSHDTNFERYVKRQEQNPEMKAALDEAREHFRAEYEREFGGDDDDGTTGVPVKPCR